MSEYQIIIKDSKGNILSENVLAKTFTKDNITIISPIISDINSATESYLNLLVTSLTKMGLENFLVFPIKSKKESIQIKKIKID